MGPPDGRRRQLDQEAERLAALTASLGRDLDEIIDSAQLNNIDDEHDPDGSTVAYERAMVTALLDAATRDLDAIEGARERLRSGTDGTCSTCGNPIAPERLQALPLTTSCVGCAS